MCYDYHKNTLAEQNLMEMTTHSEGQCNAGMRHCLGMDERACNS